MRSRTLRFFAGAGVVLALGACGDAGPVSAPGTVTAVVTSPNGSEGAAIISFPSEGVGAIGAVSGEVFSRVDGAYVTVLVVNEPGGELAFSMALADTTQKPIGLVEQVAAPNDVLRSTLAGYVVEYRR